MKKIKRTLAGLLAAAILIQAAPTGGALVNASAESPAASAQADSAAAPGEGAASSAGSESSSAGAESESASSSDSESAASEADSKPGSDSASESESTSSEAASDAASESADSVASDAADSASAAESDSADEEPADDVAETADENAELAVQAETLTIEQALGAEREPANKTITLDTDIAEKLILLSHCNQAELQDYTITINQSGALVDLTGTATYGSKIDYEFIGFGTKDNPFQGKIEGQFNGITTKTTLFNGLSFKAQLSNNGSNLGLNWLGDGSVPMIADTYVMEDNGAEGESKEHTLPIKVTAYTKKTSGTENTTGTLGSLLGTVKGSGTLKITGNEVDYGAATVTVTPASGNAGLICDTLDSGNITIENGYTFPNDYSVETKDANGNAGSLVGAMRDNTVLIVKPEFKTAKTVKAPAHAGGLVGSMGANAQVNLNAAMKVPDDGLKVTASTTGDAGGMAGNMAASAQLNLNAAIEIQEGKLTVESTNGNAGGLVGLMADEAKITTAEVATATLNSQTITGGVSAGGVVGDATDVTFTDDSLKSKLTVTSPTVTGSKSGANVGGLAGKYTLTKNGEYTLPAKIELTSPSVSVNGEVKTDGGNEGGYFGLLQLNEGVTYTIGGQEQNSKADFTANCQAGKAQSYGGVVGQLLSGNEKSKLIIQHFAITSNFNATEKGNRPGQHGGLVGCVGNAKSNENIAYLEVNDVSITATNPYADWNFGGISSYLAEKCILQAKDVTVKTSGSDNKIYEGAGILGVAKDGSALELSGTTDLTGVTYNSDAKQVAYLVRENNNALIYAKGSGNEDDGGWVYKRGNGSKINDIANYGQIIRLKADSAVSDAKGLNSKLITIDDQYHVVLPLKTWRDTITLSSADDFALFSIAWNSRGYFSADSSVNDKTWGNLKGKAIELSADIDLSGTGILGLSRDTYSSTSDDTFTGNLNGQNHTLTLAVGENFGTYQNNGDGRIYTAKNGGDIYHGALGIFAQLDGSTKGIAIKDLILAGSMSASNANYDFMMGGIAAVVKGTVNISKVKTGAIKENTTTPFSVQVHYDDYRDTTNAIDRYIIVGSLFGRADGTTMTFENEASINSKIEIFAAEDDRDVKGYAKRDSKVMVGGVIGQGREYSNNNWYNNQFTINDLTISGKIIAHQKYVAAVGGFIGSQIGNINDKNNSADYTTQHTITIKNLKFDNFEITADGIKKDAGNSMSTSADKTLCGGLLAAVLTQTDVTFGSDNGNKTQYALSVINSKISAPNANGVGGLCYRASGRWTINDYGIDLSGLSINAGKDLGLLVCRGEKCNTAIANGGDGKYYGALYLQTTAHCDSAYKVNTTNTTEKAIEKNDGVFDEFVAYTAASANAITNNGANGVVSIATQSDSDSRIGVKETNTSDRTTYQNRTAYGQQHNTNAYSRYYYDLDQWLAEANKNGSNGTIDTPQELLLWSVYRYASQNIKSYFTDTTLSEIQQDGTITIGPANGEAILDMQKYSYYPIILTSANITVQNATIKFYNTQIEAAEQNNKTTQFTANGTGSKFYSQHYTMHCGLIYQYDASNAQFNVTNTTFAGSVGRVNDGKTSGALIADNAQGHKNDSTAEKQPITLNLNDVKLDGLQIAGYSEKTDYAPLLIGSLGSYTILNLNTLTSDYTNKTGTAAASSLIGNVGGSNNENINLSFSNISLPDKAASASSDAGIFTHATLLESFAYTANDTTSNATYNFYQKDDWKDWSESNKGTYDKHNVTYGKEIKNTVEYPGMQLWYYDEKLHGTDAGLVPYGEDGQQKGFTFDDYLPYVKTAYTENGTNHEIKVNHRVTDILTGCGTYSHPYTITSEKEMEILAEYMANGKPRNEWRVRITTNQNQYHTASDTMANEAVYQYSLNDDQWYQVTKPENSDTWTSNGITLKNEAMLQYLLNAYYDIQGSNGGNATAESTLTVQNFGGFGSNPLYAFRGVITTSNQTTLVLTGSSNALIPYSYGSVVNKLKIEYKKNGNTGRTLSYKSPSAKYHESQSVFGGVIGCVLGGDNILDGVSVTIADKWLTLESYIKDKKEYKQLVPIGGYVGEVAGGGVIFRNMADNAGKLTNAAFTSDSGVSDLTGTNTEEYKNLYVNPYVGRVLDGFAFYEVTKTGTNVSGLATELINTDKNYKINTLDGNASITVNDNTVTPQNAQGLLVLSAIVNSGAASGGSSNAYSQTSTHTYSTKGTGSAVRYSFAGDYGKVRNAKYDQIGTVPSSTDNESTFSKADDFTKPGEGSLPYLIQKYGNGQKEIFSLCNGMTVALQQGENIDYNMAQFGTGYQGIGGRYNSIAISTGTNTDAKNIVPQLNGFNGNNASITLDMQVKEYYNDDFSMADNTGVRGIGGVFNLFRGKGNCTVNNLTLKSNNKTNGVIYQYYDSNGIQQHNKKDIHVGAFAGTNTGISNSDSTLTFDNVTVSNLTINSPQNAGGIMGSAYKRANKAGVFLLGNGNATTIIIKNSNYNGINVYSVTSAGGFVGNINNSKTNEFNIKDADFTIDGGDSIIQSNNAGGAFGLIESDLKITTDATLTMKNITVNADQSAGGFVGTLQSQKSITVTSNKTLTLQEIQVKADQDAGGFIGTVEDGTMSVDAKEADITLNDVTVSGGGTAGGFIGIAKKNKNDPKLNINSTAAEKQYVKLQDVSVTSTKEKNSTTSSAGGFLGKITSGSYTIQNVEVKSTESATQPMIKIDNGNSTGTYYAGGMIGYSNTSAESTIQNCTVQNVQINTEENAKKHDYNQNTDGIQTNYIAGGFAGYVKGSKTTFNNCTLDNGSKVYGSVAGGIAGQTEAEIVFKNCVSQGESESNQSTIAQGFSTAGGILGFRKTGVTITIQSCTVQNMKIQGSDWGTSALIGDSDPAATKGIIYLFDSAVKNSSVTIMGNQANAGGRWPCVGAITGSLRTALIASNLLFSGVKLDGHDGMQISTNNTLRKGLLFGEKVGNQAISIAGLSIQNVSEGNKDWKLENPNEQKKKDGNTFENGYIAFADYFGTATKSREEDRKDLKDATGVFPYVTVSPLGSLQVSIGTGTRNLYGDGVKWSSELELQAKTILSDSKASDKPQNKYTYANVKNISFEFDTAFSTYNDNQNNKVAKNQNFPVLQISQSNVNDIIQYLDIITNGGFSQAEKSPKASVKAKTELYYNNNGSFSTDKNKPSQSPLRAITDADGKINFSVNADYDNTKDRFTLLTVTFTEKDADKNEHKYNVFVPIIVRRMLEVDFSATLTYGTDFGSKNYQNIDKHMLESFGSSITGYLTYTYNSSTKQFVEYGWQSYIDAGGNVAQSMGKKLRFFIGEQNNQEVNIPEGTQLTLVDADTGKAYYHTVTADTGKTTGGYATIPFSEFKDSSGKAYTVENDCEKTIGELIGATAATAEGGKFVQVDKDGKLKGSTVTDKKPTVKIKNDKGEYEYYRLAESGETGDRYSITVVESKLQNGGESTMQEKYYLVITIPDGTNSSPLNGYLTTEFGSNIPYSLHELLIKDKNGNWNDEHKNTSSTYQLSSGYQQVLSENGDDVKKLNNKNSNSQNDSVKVINVNDTKMYVDVTDAITFPNGQLYLSIDELYLRFVGSLQTREKGTGTSETVSSRTFPSETTGEAKFYVYTQTGEQKTYYAYDSTTGWSQATEESEATSYTWTSTGGNMELPLQDKAGNLISLQGLRDLLKEQNKDANTSTFYVRAKMQLDLPKNDLSVIPEWNAQSGKNDPENYAQFNYSSQLSVTKDSLTYSSNRQSVNQTAIKYYRDQASSETLTLTPDWINQLGINPHDLQNGYVKKIGGDTYSLIDASAKYDLSNLAKKEDRLQNSSGIKFTLTLEQKDQGEDSKYSQVTSAGDYLKVQVDGQSEDISYDQKNNSFTWIVPKEQYYDEKTKALKTDGSFDGNILKQHISLLVNVSNVEENDMKHQYGNYKVVLTAEILDSSQTSSQSEEKATDNLIYTLAKIQTEFVDTDTSKTTTN